MPEVGVDKHNIVEFYDSRYGEGYMEAHTGIGYLRVASVLKRVAGGARSVLDFGCGQGAWMGALCDAFPGIGITGIDISSNAVGRAKQSRPAHKFVLFDGSHAPFGDGSFDFFFSYHVLEHVYDIDSTVGEMSRLLKESGRMLIIMPCGNEGSFEEYVVRLIRNSKEETPEGGIRFFYEDPGHLRRMKSEELIAKFSLHGIAAVEQYFSNQFWGAVEWISSPGIISPGYFFDSSRGVSRAARTKLGVMRWLFFLLASARRLAVCDLHGKAGRCDGALKKAAILSLSPLKAMLQPVEWLITGLARYEWNHNNTRQNGSEQYLILRKVPEVRR